MKVIVAGMPKTGTKTMKAALEELGFTVYDLLENFEHLNKDWQKIFNEGGTTEDFRRMFENVDAVTDVPGCYFWDEIYKAFPEAKVSCFSFCMIEIVEQKDLLRKKRKRRFCLHPM